MSYEPTIGLEVHAELKTRTKMFCDSPNNPDPLRRSFPPEARLAKGGSEASEPEPNTNVCPVCLGHPGTLPTINKVAVEAVIKVGLALGGKVNPVTKFDRKNYFYPDLPKGYQISQYDKPLIVGGELLGVRLRRIHLEEDTGRLLHEAPSVKSRGGKADASYVDFNRAGVPLMELVTEPDIRSAEQAVSFGKELQLILQYLKVSDADMEKGHMRLEANVSLSRPNANRIKSNDDRIVLKDESYKLMGLLFEIQNKLGSVYKEKNYQDAIEEILKREKISYEREKKFKLKLDNLEVSDFLADFLISEKIILEVKAAKFITQENIRQALRYIKSLNVPLAIIANFRGTELEYKRVINPAFDKYSESLDANSSDYALGTKVELKNINSFKALGSAIAYELDRQKKALESGEKVVQETRGWNETEGKTVSQRSKEEAHDYRYFPEPDLPPFETSLFGLQELKRSLPELPAQRRERFSREYGLGGKQAEALVADPGMAEYFEAAVSELATRDELSTSTIGKKPRELLFNYLTSDLRGLLNEAGTGISGSKVIPEHLAHLVDLIADGKIASRQAKDILKRMFLTGADPEEILEGEGLQIVSGEAELSKAVEEVIGENPRTVSDYKKGKTASVQFLVGKVMQKTRGRAHVEELKKILMGKLEQ